ncbi:DUF4123 domain-containing protein [Paracoccus alkanivorans]|uniref:DUF4123 domain-containing protein n=1 Tax=Paracoccus alkanivorans TaxID=2116655 RepID=A0A3M0MJN9_9RHOB|nr:DUF4123 domain-containing protein [Paracoccus alkanivorans]RMC37829.1 DUF4123 domain-containing protein [Paracoccus alkanivorans]
MLLHQVPIRNDASKPSELTILAEAVPDAPPALLKQLYGPEAPSRVYMLVDGVLRSEVAGIFDLDSIGLPAHCLFEGDALEAGPWLVDMSIGESGNPSILPFHRKFFTEHWPIGTSLLIQTDASSMEVRQHLRRFTKLPVQDDGKWRLFRFWDPRVLSPFLQAIAEDAPRLRRMMLTDDGKELHYIIRDGEIDVRLSPETEKLIKTPVTPMRLHFSDFDPIARTRAADRRKRMAERIRADFTQELEHRPAKAIEAAVEHAMRHFGAYGFRNHAYLHFFAAWTVFYGPGFETRDPAGTLEEICRSTAPEAERFRAFRVRFESFKMRAA